MTVFLSQLVRQIIDNDYCLTFDEALAVYHAADIEELGRNADTIRRHFCGNRADLCGILNAKSGLCSEDCKYCAQSAHYQTTSQVYPLVSINQALGPAREHAAAGTRRYSLVTSGARLSEDDLQRACKIFQAIGRETAMHLCASFGILSEHAFRALRKAGVHRYHHNIETSREYYPEICSTHMFEDRLTTLRHARAAGMELCCGGIIGMGETPEDRVSFAKTLREFDVISIPLNVLMPIPGTPLENRAPLAEEEILRTVALLRFVNPRADIRLAGGRIQMHDNGRRAFCFGANAAITGNMLTTCGNSMAEDRAMLSELGFEL